MEEEITKDMSHCHSRYTKHMHLYIERESNAIVAHCSSVFCSLYSANAAFLLATGVIEKPRRAHGFIFFASVISFVASLRYLKPEYIKKGQLHRDAAQSYSDLEVSLGRTKAIYRDQGESNAKQEYNIAIKKRVQLDLKYMFTDIE